MGYYNPYITGWYNPLYTANNQGFFHISIEKGKSSEPNLHDFGFQPLISSGIIPTCPLEQSQQDMNHKILTGSGSGIQE